MDEAEPVIGPESGIPVDELLALYKAVGWSAYTGNPGLLQAGVAGSSYVVTARRGGRLVGLARALSDGATICYLQDVLVHPGEQRRGIGRALVRAVLDRYRTVRQKVLLTDDEPGQRAFTRAWAAPRSATTDPARCAPSSASTTEPEADSARPDPACGVQPGGKVIPARSPSWRLLPGDVDGQLGPELFGKLWPSRR